MKTLSPYLYNKTHAQDDDFGKIIEEVADYAIFSLDKNGIVLNWNKGAKHIKGYTAEEIIGKHFDVFYTKEDKEKNLPRELLEKAAKNGKAINEGWRVKKNGESFWASVVITATHNDKNEVSGFLKVTRDLTERKIAAAQLKSSEQNYRHVLSSISEGFFMLDINCRFIVVNKAAKKMIERISGRIIQEGDSAFDFLPEEKQKVLQLNVNRTFEGIKSAYESYYQVRERNFWLNLSYTPVRDGNKRIVGACIIASDITEQKNAEQELDKSQRLFKSFMENTPAMGWIIDEENRFRYLNKAYKNNFRLSESAIGRSIYEIFPKPICDAFIENNLRAWKTGSAIETVEEGVGPNGEKQIYQIYKFPLGEENGIKLLGGVALDITNNVLAQENLRLSNERYDYAMKATSDAIWDWYIKKDILYSGEGYRNIFGYETPPSSMQQRMAEIHPKDIERVKKSLKKALKGEGDRWQSEYRFRCADSSYKNIFEQGYILRDRKKQALRMIGAMQNITEQKALEQKLADEEKTKKQEIIQAIIAAQEKERRELAYELHDNVNQILSSSKLMLDVVAESPETNLEFVDKANSYLSDAIKELRRISHNLSPGILQDISLEAAIQDIIDQINSAGKLHIIYRKRNYTKTANRMNGDIQLTILRIAQEQLNNIIKYADATEVLIQLFITKTKIVLSIKDDGKGFDIAKTKKGLGLHNIVNRTEYYQGTALLESAPQQGCTLKIEIPL